MDSLLQDLRYAARSLRQTPAFTIAAALTLSLGIGINTGVFSVVNGVLLKPLPYPEPDRIVRIFETAPAGPDALRSIAHPTLADWSTSVKSFDALALFGPTSLDLTGAGRPEQLNGAAVSAEFFRAVGVSPALGRDFLEQETRPRGPLAIILSDGLWRRRYGADRAILGRSLQLGSRSFTVIGVMPRGFAYPDGADFWVSTATDAEYEARGARHLGGIARLKPGVTLESATADLMQAEHRLADAYPRNYAGFGVLVIPLVERITGSVRTPLLVLLAAVAAILLIACGNVANLVLARAAGRQREIAVRVALGAPGSRIARQLVLESLLLSGIGAAAGAFGAWWMLVALRALANDRVPRLAEIGLDQPVLGFTALVAVVSGLIVGLLPAIQLVSADLHVYLKEGGRSQTSSRRQRRLRGGLVVGQFAFTLALLSAAGLLVKSFMKLAVVDAGVATRGVLTFHVGLSGARQEDAAFVVSFYRQLRDRLRAIPGVTGAAFASRLPLSGEDHSTSIRLAGEAVEPGRERSVQDRAVTPGYFTTLGIPVRGRDFSDLDGPSSRPVALINETLARRYFSGREPIGEIIIVGGKEREIIGVAGDARQFGLDAPAEPELYFPHAQSNWPWMSVVVRSDVPATALLPALESAVWSLDPGMPLTDVRTMSEMRSASVADRRFSVVLIGTFAALAMVLAAIGIYGVMAYIAAERRQEVGIRLALGASPREVVCLVVNSGLRLAAIGVGTGLLLAAASTRGIRGMLFEVSALDPGTIASVTVVLGVVAAVACYLPARRAANVDPVSALRRS